MAGEQTIGKLVVQVLMDASGYDEEAKKVATSTSNLGKIMGQTADMIQGMFVTAAKAATAASIGLAAASLAVGSGFEKAMSQVAAVSGASAEELAALEKKARELGAATVFSATEAANGMEELARAGLSTNEIIEASGSVLKMAAASNIELAQAATITAATMAQFGLEASETDRITDVLTRTTQTTLFSMESLAEAMKFAGTVGASFGMTIEETSASVAQFANLGLEGSMAGTQFRMAMASAAKPTGQAAAALKKYGLTIQDINPEVKSFRDIMLTVGEAGINVADSMAIFGTRAGANVKQVAGAMAESSEDFDTLFENLAGAAGTTEATYEKMTDNVLGRFAELRSAAEEVLITLFDTYSGPLKKLLESMTLLVRMVGIELGETSDVISSDFGESISSLSALIEENAAAWAEMIVGFIKGASEVASVINTQVIPAVMAVIPYLDEIAIIMAAILVGVRVAQFAALMQAVLIPAISATTFSVSGLAAAVAAASGGLTLIIPLILAAGAGLGILAAKQRDSSVNAAELASINEELGTSYENLDEAVVALEASLDKTLEKFNEWSDDTGMIFHELDELGRVIEGTGKTSAEWDEHLKEKTAPTAAEVAKAKRKQAEAQTAAATAAKKEGDAQKKASDAVDRMLQKTEALNAAASGEALTGEDLILHQIEQRRQAMRDAADDALATAGLSASQQEQIQQALSDSMVSLDKLTIAKIQKGRDDARAEAEKASEASDERVAESRLKARQKANDKHRKDLVAVGEALLKIEEEKLTKRERMERDHQKMMLGLHASTEEEKAILEDDFRKRMKRARLDDVSDFANKVGGAFMQALDAVGSVVSGVVGIIAGGLGLVTELTGASLNLSDLLDSIINAETASTGPVGVGGTRASGLGSAGVGPQAAARAAVDEFVDGTLLMIDSIIEAIPVLVDALVTGIPALVDGVIAAIPDIITAITDAIPDIIAAIIDKLPDLVDGLFTALGDILGFITVFVEDSLPGILTFVTEELIPELLGGLPDLITGLVAGAATLVVELIKSIPDLVTGIIEALPDIITSLVFGIIEAIPEIVTALIQMIPVLTVELLASLFVMFRGIIKNTIEWVKEELPDVARDFVREFIQGIKDAGEQIKEIISSLFGRDKDKDKDGGIAYSGINYVPATMRMTVHQGEAIVPASRNARRGVGADPALAGARGFSGGGGAAPTVDLSVILNNEVVDRAIISGIKQGRAPNIQRLVDKKAGVTTGFTPGKFSIWTK